MWSVQKKRHRNREILFVSYRAWLIIGKIIGIDYGKNNVPDICSVGGISWSTAQQSSAVMRATRILKMSEAIYAISRNPTLPDHILIKIQL